MRRKVTGWPMLRLAANPNKGDGWFNWSGLATLLSNLAVAVGQSADRLLRV